MSAKESSRSVVAIAQTVLSNDDVFVWSKIRSDVYRWEYFNQNLTDFAATKFIRLVTIWFNGAVNFVVVEGCFGFVSNFFIQNKRRPPYMKKAHRAIFTDTNVWLIWSHKNSHTGTPSIIQKWGVSNYNKSCQRYLSRNGWGLIDLTWSWQGTSLFSRSSKCLLFCSVFFSASNSSMQQ